MPSAEFLIKKRAVYTGLQSFLTSAQLMQAMILWENKYANEPKFAMRKFVADLCKKYGKSLAEAEVLGKLIRTMALPENKLLPDPSVEIDFYKKHFNVKSRVIKRSIELMVFMEFMEELIKRLPFDVHRTVKSYLIDGLHSIDISTSFRREMVFWLKGKTKTVEMPSVDIHQMRMVINFTYVALCEYVGPIQADQMLGEVVQQLQRMHDKSVEAIVMKLI